VQNEGGKNRPHGGTSRNEKTKKLQTKATAQKKKRKILGNNGTGSAGRRRKIKTGDLPFGRNGQVNRGGGGKKGMRDYKFWKETTLRRETVDKKKRQ